tara:strand:+ start:2733 stop:2921 length:189 start_codon:yes stop_codon:yes gene_type:complete
MPVSSFEQERLARINSLMGEIHDATNEVYESFVDRDYDKVKLDVTHLIRHLKSVIDSVDNEV